MTSSPTDSRLSDLELVREALREDSTARRRLFRRLECVPRIVALLNQRSGCPFSEVDQSELSQEVVLWVWKKLSTFEGRARLETWVYKYCYYEFMNRFRKRMRRKAMSLQDHSALDRVAAPPQPVPMEFEDLESALGQLASLDEQVIRLKHYQGLTFREIAEHLGISLSAAKAHYYRALDSLRKTLDGAPR